MYVEFSVKSLSRETAVLSHVSLSKKNQSHTHATFKRCRWLMARLKSGCRPSNNLYLSIQSHNIGTQNPNKSSRCPVPKDQEDPTSISTSTHRNRSHIQQSTVDTTALSFIDRNIMFFPQFNVIFCMAPDGKIHNKIFKDMCYVHSRRSNMYTFLRFGKNSQSILNVFLIKHWPICFTISPCSKWIGETKYSVNSVEDSFYVIVIRPLHALVHT